MRWNALLLVGMGFVTVLALLPEGEDPRKAQAEYERGFNEGYQSATRVTLTAAQGRRLGEFYFDQSNQRSAFRWFCDYDSKVDAPPASTAPERSPQRVTQLSRERHSAETLVRRRAG
jgi:hypothetical protein